MNPADILIDLIADLSEFVIVRHSALQASISSHAIIAKGCTL
jgi:hypothetical protein